MAEQGYGCVFGDCPKAINHLITTINPAASVELCDEHYVVGLIPIVAAELGLDPGEFYGQVEKIVNREQAKAAKALAAAEAAKAAEDAKPPDTVDGDEHQGDGDPVFVITGVDPEQGIVGVMTE